MVKKMLVCGATGFIGRNIAEYFASNSDYEVYGTYCNSKPFKHPDIALLEADLTEKKDVDRVVQDKDVIIQAAANTSGVKDIFSKPQYHVADNAIMNALLFKSAFDHHVSNFVFLSCLTVYPSKETPVKETDFEPDKIHPKYFCSAWTKIYNENMCRFYSDISNTKYLIVRHSNIYGPYDKYDLEKSHVFGATITKVMTTGDGDKIVVWGEGKEERDLLYVSDLVSFIELGLEKQKNNFELCNVGYGSTISIRDLVKKIIKISGKNLEIEYDSSKPSIKTKVIPDITRAKKEFGWGPKTSLEEGITKTIKWYNDNLQIIKGVC
jgi:nucleoside-diphosphate-sugar epimerase